MTALEQRIEALEKKIDLLLDSQGLKILTEGERIEQEWSQAKQAAISGNPRLLQQFQVEHPGWILNH